MRRSQAGIGIHDLHLPTRTALKRAADLEFGVVEIGTARGDTTPRQLSASGRRELARLVASHGMSIAALDVDVPNGLLAHGNEIDQRISEARATLELARDMRVSTVVARAGPAGSADALVELLHELGQHADRTGTVLAIQAGDVPADALLHTIRQLNCPALRVCVDPAALIMAGCDPTQVIGEFTDTIGMSHLRDATAGMSGHETALGTGQVDLTAIAAALDAAGYHGPQIVRRSDPACAAAEIARAKSVLDSLSIP